MDDEGTLRLSAPPHDFIIVFPRRAGQASWLHNYAAAKPPLSPSGSFYGSVRRRAVGMRHVIGGDAEARLHRFAQLHRLLTRNLQEFPFRRGTSRKQSRHPDATQSSSASLLGN
jgi:hypothetical protein